MTQPSTSSVTAAQAERLAERLTTYRKYVQRAAAGERLHAENAEELDRIMQTLGLPGYAWRRDVRAMARAGGSGRCSPVELQLLHPHLFDEPSTWVRDRIRAVERSRHRHHSQQDQTITGGF